MLVQKVQRSAISPLILLPNLIILQIRPCRHPPLDLASERLHIVRLRQIIPERRHIGRVLVLRRQQRHGHIHGLGIIRRQHGRMALHGGLEGLVLLAGRQHRDLAAPAVPEDRPVKGLPGGRELVGLVDDARDPRQSGGRGGLGLEEVAELGLVVVGLGREPGDVGGLALEEVGDEDAVFLRVGCREDVRALEGLGEEAEDICRLVRWWVGFEGMG